MTEAEWLVATDPDSMIKFIKFLSASNRKGFLFGCACCHRIWNLLEDARSRRFIDVKERHVDGLVNDDEMLQAAEAARIARTEIRSAFRSKPVHHDRDAEAALGWASVAADTNTHSVSKYSRRAAASAVGASRLQNRSAQECEGRLEHQYAQEGEVHCRLLRDIFGNPFRPVAIEPEWLTPDVLALTTGIYADRAFDRMPILADALQDAGCDNDDILNHCRQPVEHVRGCWVVDLILGKS